jgi:hypothetical protein
MTSRIFDKDHQPEANRRTKRVLCAGSNRGKSALLFCCMPFARCLVDFSQAVARLRVQVKLVKPLQLSNSFKRTGAERRFPIECVQHNALKNVAQRHIVIFGERLKHLQDPLLHANPGLHPLDFQP